MAERKVILISGASRGIGRAIAERLLQENYALSLGVRHPEDLAGTELAASDQVLLCPYEATDKEAGRNWVEKTVAQWGRIDGLINCAGILRPIRFDEEDETLFDELFEINVKAPWRLSRAAFPYLKQSGEGRIINLVSMSGKRVKGTLAGYSMSKFALMALSQAMRNVGWEDGIRVTALCPSWVNTEMAAKAPLDPQEMTQPEDVAEMVLTVLRLPNSASVSELAVNCNLET
ncbi:MAG: SDR family NAD(P)-dependent oxidoreductase [Snowella sp.]|nr:SDR family NAD(P)-dependent oxidoreductase [Snowella sp.]